MSVGENIKKTRKKIGLTQKQLGDLLNVSEVMISHWENNKRIPKIESIKKIASALDVSVYNLIDTNYFESGVATRDLLLGKDEVTKNDKSSNSFEKFKELLKNTGYSLEPMANNSGYKLIKDGNTAKFSNKEFKELQTKAIDSVDVAFFKKIIQKNNKKDTR